LRAKYSKHFRRARFQLSFDNELNEEIALPNCVLYFVEVDWA